MIDPAPYCLNGPRAGGGFAALDRLNAALTPSAELSERDMKFFLTLSIRTPY